MVYQISYDLKSDTADYSALFEQIRSLGPYLGILKSTWLVSTAVGPEIITDRLHTAMQDGDRLFISEVTRGRFNGWHAHATWQWIDQQLDRCNGK